MTTPWRNHPKLAGRFHLECPDDVRVLVHDGGPRLTEHRPELVWVRITACHDDLFTGRVLNKPRLLKTVAQDAEIQFIAPAGGDHLILVRDKYLRERDAWKVHPCSTCGLTELFDAPSDLIRKVFPDLAADTAMQAFSAFCGVCGGVQMVQNAIFTEDPENAPARRPEELPLRKRWWQWWRGA